MIDTVDRVSDGSFLTRALGAFGHLEINHLSDVHVIIQIAVLLRRCAVDWGDGEVVVLQPSAVLEDGPAFVLKVEDRIVFHLGLSTDVDGGNVFVDGHPIATGTDDGSGNVLALDFASRHFPDHEPIVNAVGSGKVHGEGAAFGGVK